MMNIEMSSERYGGRAGQTAALLIRGDPVSQRPVSRHAAICWAWKSGTHFSGRTAG